MVVEDDPAVRAAVAVSLSRLGFDVEAHDNGVSAARALAERTPDVLIVDRMLPGRSGDELCREVRSAGGTPILMLTALAEVEDRIEGLELGADDYLAKPFSLRELALRVRALLRRSRAAAAAADLLTVGRFSCDAAHRRVWVDGRETVLTGREYELLHYFMRHPGETVSRDALLEDAWGWSIGDAATVTVHVRRLREKVEPDPGDPRYLRTVWGAGYRFTPDGVDR
ncbi:DNA-binding response regulator [Leucobacter zeae]|nr:DNA-binding response regulator [Leucobacter zeae]